MEGFFGIPSCLLSLQRLCGSLLGDSRNTAGFVLLFFYHPFLLVSLMLAAFPQPHTSCGKPENRAWSYEKRVGFRHFLSVQCWSMGLRIQRLARGKREIGGVFWITQYSEWSDNRCGLNRSKYIFLCVCFRPFPLLVWIWCCLHVLLDFIPLLKW